MSSLIVSVIGKGGRAGEIIRVLDSIPSVELKKIFYPKPVESSDQRLTSNFEDILNSRAIIISSPTYTHKRYIELLENFDGYILVEKPGLSTREEYHFLRNISNSRKERIKINYNLRESELKDILEKYSKDPAIGRLLHLDVSIGHGLSFKTSYRESWRSDAEKSIGVAELLSIHYIDLINFLFGPIKKFNSTTISPEEKNTPPKTVSFELETEQVKCTIWNSYESPSIKRVRLIGENGFLEYDGEKVRVYSPRDTFGPTGKFVQPKIIEEIDLDYETLLRESSINAILKFIEIAKGKQRIPPSEFENSLDSMLPVLELKEKFKIHHGLS